jgi:hypothetical protein
MGKPVEKKESKVKQLTCCSSLSPSTYRPVKLVVSELFTKSRDDVRPCFGSPVPFEAWEKLNCLPVQVVSVQIVGVDLSLFDFFINSLS